jgi:16S rRNA (guanine527-N7)-methyltransferase
MRVNREAFKFDCKEIGLSLNDPQLDAFESFENALYEWNKVKNLTRIPKEECATKHFLDSLLVGVVIREYCPSAKNILDVGTGPGFPAWPLACAFPDWQVTAVDSNGKMLDFLKANPLPNLTIVQKRVEEWDQFEKFDVATGRAVAPLALQLEMSMHWIKKGGWLIPMRTPSDEVPTAQILSRHSLKLEAVKTIELGRSNIHRVFPILVKQKSTRNINPRRWSEIKRKPWF